MTNGRLLKSSSSDSIPVEDLLACLGAPNHDHAHAMPPPLLIQREAMRQTSAGVKHVGNLELILVASVAFPDRPCEYTERARVLRCPPQGGRSWKLWCGRVGLATEIDMQNVVLPPDDIAVASGHGRVPTQVTDLDRCRRCAAFADGNAGRT